MHTATQFTTLINIKIIIIIKVRPFILSARVHRVNLFMLGTFVLFRIQVVVRKYPLSTWKPIFPLPVICFSQHSKLYGLWLVSI